MYESWNWVELICGFNALAETVSYKKKKWRKEKTEGKWDHKIKVIYEYLGVACLIDEDKPIVDTHAEFIVEVKARSSALRTPIFPFTIFLARGS